MEREPIIPKTRQTVNRRGGEGAPLRERREPGAQRCQGCALAPRPSPDTCELPRALKSTQFATRCRPSHSMLVHRCRSGLPKGSPFRYAVDPFQEKEISRGSHRRRNRGGPAHKYRYILGGKKGRGEFYPFSCVRYRFAGISLPVMHCSK